MISAVLESRLREAEWDAETARVMGDADALLSAIQTADELRAEKARLAKASLPVVTLEGRAS